MVGLLLAGPPGAALAGHAQEPRPEPLYASAIRRGGGGTESDAGQEVEDLWNNGDFIQSQSVLGGSSSVQLRDVFTCDVLLETLGNLPAAIYYDKKHVFATEIKSEKYTVSPRAPTFCFNHTTAS